MIDSRENDSTVDNNAIKSSEDAVKETRIRVNALDELGKDGNGVGLISEKSRKIVWQISRSFSDWKHWRQDVCSALCDEKYPDIAIKFSKHLFDIGPAVDDSASKLSVNLFNSLWHFCQFDEFRKALGSLKAVPLFLDYLTTVKLYLEHISIKDPPEEYPLIKWTIAKCVIHILQQLAKDQNLKVQFEENKVYEVLVKFLTIENEGIKVVTACCLALLVERSHLRSDFKCLASELAEFVSHALLVVEQPRYQGVSVKDLAESLYLVLVKDIDDDDDVKEPIDYDKMLTETKKVKFVVALITDGDDFGQKCGALLFRSFCDGLHHRVWMQPLLNIVMSKKSADDVVHHGRAGRVTQFLAGYQVWVKRRAEGAGPDVPAVEVEGFSTKKNTAVKSVDMAISETQLRIKFLAKYAELSPQRLVSDVLENVFDLISTSYQDWESWRAELLNTAIQEQYPALCVKYLTHCINVRMAVDTATYNLSSAILSALWNFTDFSPAIRIELGNVGFIQLTMDHLAKPRKPAVDKQTSRENQLIFVIINTVYNMSRSIELKQQFLNCNSVNILKEYLGMSPLVKSVVILFMAHVLSDTPEATKLAHDEDVVPTIVKYTEMAMKNRERKCLLVVRGAEITSVGYSLDELVEGLALLAVNDSIKETLMQHNACGIVSYLLKAGSPSLEGLGVDLLWTLSFLQSARQQLISSEEKLVDSLRRLSNSTTTTGDVRRNATRALAFIEQWENKVAAAEASSDENGRQSVVGKRGHVFISYSWKQQQTVLKIKQELLKNNFTVWMDVDKLHGDLLDTMAEAIEKASAVLICFSNTYKQSNPCRTEAQYAHALCKPIIPVNMEYHYFPDGWLGILVRSRKFVDMSLEKRKFEEAFDQLLNELRSFDVESTLPPELAPPLGGGHSAVMPEIYSDTVVAAQRSFANWSQLEVQNWLEQEKLTEFSSDLSSFDGAMLSTLYTMKSTAPEFYYKTESKHHNGKLQGLLKLLGVLDRLFNVL